MAASPAFTDIADATIAANVALTDTALQQISQNAKFGIVRPEYIYMGFYRHGDTIALPVSPVDGYSYAAGEVNFNFQLYSTRGVGTGFVSGQATPPPIAFSQSGNLFWFTVDINSSRVVQLNMAYADGTATVHDGMIKVVAICQRTAALAMGAIQTYLDGSEDVFAVAQPLRVGNAANKFGIQDVSHNAKFGVVRHEVFYKGFWAAGYTIPAPTSPVDGYVYSVGEVIFKPVLFSNLAPAGAFANGQTTVPSTGAGTLARRSGKGPLYWWAANVNGLGQTSSVISYFVQGGAETQYSNDGIFKMFLVCQRGSSNV